MQLRKHAAPPLGDSFFTAGVAMPPDFAGATLAPDGIYRFEAVMSLLEREDVAPAAIHERVFAA